MKKKIIVTGGAGYIGSHTCVELIESNYEPIIIDNFYNSKHFIIDRIEEITGFRPDILDTDCLNYDRLKLEIGSYNNISGIIHFAAYKAVGESTQEPLKYYQNNIGSTINMLKLLGDFKFSNFIFSSSCTVYGQPQQLPVT
ncbi:MAG: NAD-dependent epimerase/dehydratase family protein, partial [Bacteroidota bacterium]